jgi:hypothetical protein
MSRINPGQARITLNAEDVEILNALVLQTHSSRTRILRLALDVYKKLSDRARGGEVVVETRTNTIGVTMPWDKDWDGLPEYIEYSDLNPNGATFQLRQHPEEATQP